MKLKNTLKFTLPALILAGTCLASISYAASGAIYSRGVGARDVNCNMHNTDVCIENNSSQNIYFNVTTLNQSGPLSPPSWVDVWSDGYYNQLYVIITDSNNNPIFSQPVNNHSDIDVGDSTSGAGAGKKLKVTVGG